MISHFSTIPSPTSYSSLTEIPQFRQYFLASEDGQPLETAFEKGVRCFLVFDEDKQDWAILEVFEGLDGRWRSFFEGQAYALERQSSKPSLLPILETGVDDGMIYTVRPYHRSESLASYAKRQGTLPWSVGAPMVRALVKTFIALREEETLFNRLDLSTIRVAQTVEDHLYLQVIGCSRQLEETHTERERVAQIATILTQLVDLSGAPESVDRLIDLAYGLDEGDCPQNLNALLDAIPEGGGFAWWPRRLSRMEHWAPRCPFQHPELKAFRDHFDPTSSDKDAGRGRGISSPLLGGTAPVPFTATSICLFAAGITTSATGWH